MMAANSTTNDRALARRMHAGDARAREELVARYLPLAGRLAWRYARRRDEHEDLAQVAAMALVKAVDRWDPDRGVELRGYVAPTVVGELRHYLRDCTWVIRPPRSLRDAVPAVHRARDELVARLGRDATVAEVAHELDWTEETVLEVLEAAALRVPASLDAPAPWVAGDRVTVGDCIPFVDPGFERAEARATIDQLTRILDARAREILRLRFEHDLSQAEIARFVGCSQIHVSRIMRASMARLQTYAGSALRPVAAAPQPG